MCRNLTLVRDTPSHNVLSFCEVSLNLLISSFCAIAETRSLPECDLDLGHRNLTLVRYTLSHYVLSFREFLKI